MKKGVRVRCFMLALALTVLSLSSLFTGSAFAGQEPYIAVVGDDKSIPVFYISPKHFQVTDSDPLNNLNEYDEGALSFRQVALELYGGSISPPPVFGTTGHDPATAIDFSVEGDSYQGVHFITATFSEGVYIVSVTGLNRIREVPLHQKGAPDDGLNCTTGHITAISGGGLNCITGLITAVSGDDSVPLERKSVNP